MRRHIRIGLVVPFATDRIPAEGPMMYPEVTFIPRGVGVRALTPEGYDAAWDAIVHLVLPGIALSVLLGFASFMLLLTGLATAPHMVAAKMAWRW